MSISKSRAKYAYPEANLTQPFAMGEGDPVNENRTMQIASLVYVIETAANALCPKQEKYLSRSIELFAKWQA